MLSPTLDLLAPLTSAAELPNHPSMSAAYNSTTLSELVQQACEMVHKEKKILWHIKTLATKFRGDQGWIPCETLCSVNDTALFTTNVIPDGTVISQSHNQTNPSDVDSISYHNDIRQDGHNKNRKLVEDGKATVRSQTEFLPRQTVPSMSGKMNDGVQLKISNSPNVNILSNTTIESASYLTDSVDVRSDNQDVEPEACPEVEPKGVDKEIVESSSSKDNVVGREELGSPVQYKDSVLGIIKQVNTKSKSNQVDDISTGHPEISTLAHPIARDDESEEVQAPSHRMTTRAQAQAASDKTVSTPARSPSRDSSAPEYIHPLYLIPPLALPDRDFGLPPAEAEETRYILMLWVQKQEEVCRGVERLHAGLMRANRMRKTVLGWCKAEGHVGEMSDGEDWYDKEEWGLEDDLKKGQLEEEDDTGNQGKKTRGRRTQ